MCDSRRGSEQGECALYLTDLHPSHLPACYLQLILPVPSISSSVCPASGSITSVTLFAPELQNLLLRVFTATSQFCEGQVQQNHLCPLVWGTLFRDYLSFLLSFGMHGLFILPSCLWQVKWICMWVAGQSLYLRENLSERTVADKHKCMAKLEEKYWGQNHITLSVGINRHSQIYFQDFFYFVIAIFMSSF